MAQPTRQEISDIRHGRNTQPDATTQFAALLNKAQGAESEPVVDPNTPSTPTEGPFAGKQLDKLTGAVLGASTVKTELPEPVEGQDFKEGSKVTTFIKQMKEDLASTRAERDQAKRELEEARKTGTPSEQAVAKEEYDRLQSELASIQSKTQTYEQSLEEERKRSKDLEGKLAQLSLDFDPDFQERYVKPFEATQNALYEMVNGLADNPQAADRIKATVLNALGSPNNQQFYTILKQIKEEDPENYSLYLPQVTSMRKLLIDRLTAVQNHDQTLQKLRTESYTTRERTVPEVYKSLDLARQEISLKEPELDTALASAEYKNFLKAQNIDPNAIELELRNALAASHREGRLDPKLVEFAAQGARKLQVAPLMAYHTNRTKELETENAQLREQLNSLRGSTTPRAGGFNPAGDQRYPLSPPPTKEEIRRMGAEERNRRMAINIPS